MLNIIIAFLTVNSFLGVFIYFLAYIAELTIEQAIFDNIFNITISTEVNFCFSEDFNFK